MHISPSLLIPFVGGVYLFGIHMILRLFQLKKLEKLVD